MMPAPQLLGALCGCAEYDDLPVRHNEDALNLALSAHVRFPTDARTADDPHTKANLLLQARARALMRSCYPPGGFVAADRQRLYLHWLSPGWLGDVTGAHSATLHSVQAC
jgi:hypothetical protein